MRTSPSSAASVPSAGSRSSEGAAAALRRVAELGSTTVAGFAEASGRSRPNASAILRRLERDGQLRAELIDGGRLRYRAA